jgi:hypothetical protein
MRARFETVPLATLENQRCSNEKTPRFQGNTNEKAGFRLRVIEGARTPDLRNHNPPL